VELRDGSRVIGTSVERRLKFHSALLGDFKLEGKDIRSIDCVTTNSAKLTTANGDVLVVSFADSDFALATSFGEVKLALVAIRSIRVSEVSSAREPSADLVAWWAGEGNARDQTGRHDGTLPFGAAFAPGVTGQAFDFDGSRRRVSVADSPAFQLTNALTLQAWIYPRQYGGFIVFRGDIRPGLDSWTVDTYQAGRVGFSMDDAANQSVQILAPVQLNQWQLVTATWERDPGEMKLYINGSLAAQTNTDLVPIAVLDPNQDAGVGIGNHGGTFHQFPFNGLIDEVKIYRRALSEPEIQSEFSAGEKRSAPDR
jgi:hypothetical protein